MKFIKHFLVVLLLVGAAFSQASFVSGVALGSTFTNGISVAQILPNATVYVCLYSAPSCDLLHVTTIYTDSTAVTPSVNPVTADARGNFGFWALGGNYQYSIVYRGNNYGPFVATVQANDGAVVHLTGNETIAGNKSFESINNVRYADQFAGSDIGAKVNAAFADCSNACTVSIPAGTYSFSTAIAYPMVANGKARLVIDKGATLNYTGAACAITGTATTGPINFYVDGGGSIVGTSAGTAAICISKFSGAKISELNISGFTTGAGIKNIGANTVEIAHVQLQSNKYGYWAVGSGDGYAPNAVNLHDSLIQNNTAWGVFLDASGDSGGGGSQQNVVVRTNIFESNGTNGNVNTGNLFVQTGFSTVIDSSFFEYFGGESKYQNVKIGDASNIPSATKIINNLFSSGGATSTILLRGYGTKIEGNLEGVVTTNFVEHLTTGSWDASDVGFNYVNSTNYHVGAGVANSSFYFDAALGTFNFYRNSIFNGGLNGAIGNTTPAAGAFTTVAANTSLTVGGGTPILKVLSATAVIDFVSTVAPACTDSSGITVTGAAVGDVVLLGAPLPPAGGNFTAYVSATDTVKVRFCALVTGDPPSATFRVDDVQH